MPVAMFSHHSDQIYQRSQVSGVRPGGEGSPALPAAGARPAGLQLMGLLCPKCSTMCQGVQALKEHMQVRCDQVQLPTDVIAPRCARAAHAPTGVTTLPRKSHRFVLKICFVQVCQIYVKSCGFQATAPAAAAARPRTAAANSARKRKLKSHIWICYACGAKAFNSGNQLAQHQRGKKCKLNLLRHDLT